ncbi:hypothetical protein D3C87_795840 [compost metagenome]
MSKTYSFLDVAASIEGPGGAFSLGSGAGIAEEGITITPTGPMNGMLIGADGEGMHSLYADRSAKIVVRLLKTSPTNKLLSEMVAFQRSSGSLHGQNTLVINDMSRNDSIACRQTAFAKIPDITYAKDGGTVEWEFDTVRMDPILGE